MEKYLSIFEQEEYKLNKKIQQMQQLKNELLNEEKIYFSMCNKCGQIWRKCSGVEWHLKMIGALLGISNVLKNQKDNLSKKILTSSIFAFTPIVISSIYKNIYIKQKGYKNVQNFKDENNIILSKLKANQKELKNLNHQLEIQISKINELECLKKQLLDISDSNKVYKKGSLKK